MGQNRSTLVETEPTNCTDHVPTRHCHVQVTSLMGMARGTVGGAQRKGVCSAAELIGLPASFYHRIPATVPEDPSVSRMNTWPTPLEAQIPHCEGYLDS